MRQRDGDVVYDEDLAYVHRKGFTWLGEAAAREIQEQGVEGLVVDLGCGDGTLAEALVDAGLPVHGIDVSPAMVALARRRVPGASFEVGDAAEVALPGCSAVTAIGEVFCYAVQAPRDLAPMLARIHEALEPGGLLLFDVAVRGRAPEETHSERSGPDWRVEATAHEDGNVLVRTIDTWRTVDGVERHAREVHRLCLFDADEVEAMLVAAGFTVERLGGYDDAMFQEGWDAFLAISAT